MDQTRVERWERSAQLPLMAVSLLFVAAYAWPILDPGLDSGLVRLCSTVVWLTWGVLVLELVVRFVAAPDKWRFVRQHPLDIAAVILPVLRPLRLLRLLTLLNVLNRYAGGSFRGRVGIYLASSVTLIVFMGSLAILDAERDGNGPIKTFGDALWWALATITTVGYGDMFPVTTEGRFVAAGLMFCGIGVLGVVTGTFASWLVERVEQIEDLEEGVTATSDDVQALREEILLLRESLQDRRA
jgi:voltage-gated potassium channel